MVRYTERRIIIYGIMFFGICFLVSIFLFTKEAGAGAIGFVIGLAMIVYSLVLREKAIKTERIESRMENMTEAESKAYLEEKGRLKARNEANEKQD